MDPVRLACLIHATSVRSEPESNSQKKDFVPATLMLLNYCFGALAGSGHLTTSFSFIVFRVPSGGSPSFRGAAGSRSFCTVLFSRIERWPFGRNGWVIYQNGPPGARGFPQKNSSFFGTNETPVKRPFPALKVSSGKPHAPEIEGNFPNPLAKLSPFIRGSAPKGRGSMHRVAKLG